MTERSDRKVRFFAHVRILFASLLMVLPTPSEAKIYEIPELPALIEVPSGWFPIDEEVVNEWNKEYASRSPKASLSFLRGFTKGGKAIGNNGGMPADPRRLNSECYFWITYDSSGKVPNSPSEFVKIILKRFNEIEGKDWAKDPITSDRAKSFKLRNPPEWDPELLAMRVEFDAVNAAGESFPVQTIIFPLQGGVLAINLYSISKHATKDFAAMQQIVSTLKLRDEARLRLSSDWYSQLPNLTAAYTGKVSTPILTRARSPRNGAGDSPSSRLSVKLNYGKLTINGKPIAISPARKDIDQLLGTPVADEREKAMLYRFDAMGISYFTNKGSESVRDLTFSYMTSAQKGPSWPSDIFQGNIEISGAEVPVDLGIDEVMRFVPSVRPNADPQLSAFVFDAQVGVYRIRIETDSKKGMVERITIFFPSN